MRTRHNAVLFVHPAVIYDLLCFYVRKEQDQDGA